MKITWTWTNGLPALALAALLWVSAITPTRAAENGEEENVTAPEAVMKAFQEAYPKAEVRGISKETEGGKVYFEIESIDGKVRRDLLYLSDGSVFEIEEGIAPSDLPAQVTDSLKARYPKGEIQKAEKITRSNVVEYEVLLENEEENLEVVIDSNGTIKSQASVSDEDETAQDGESEEAEKD